ncbi:MAG: GntR family transcriptional regulator / MocR family aminotransferase [Chloroflexota bacterium]|jgi:DNA-binding transcriptional regulator YhcF (GntR family)|nr:GntR family transcriptional regulator / MocR family aminotransferase [Chloroflexota bacterium]
MVAAALSEIAIPIRPQEPAYKRLARGIRDRIKSGQLQPGDKLPPRRALAAALHVSVYTVEQAYNLLAREGLVAAGGQGTRTLVANPQARRGAPPHEDGGRFLPPAQRLVCRVQQIESGPDGVDVYLCLTDGQLLTFETSHAAVDWLQLTAGTMAEVCIDDEAISLTRSDSRP